MDLSDIDLLTKSTNGVKMPLKHPVSGEILRDDKEDEMYIELTGPQHPDYKRMEAAITDQRLGRRKMKLKSADITSEQIELAVVSTKSWNINLNGAVPDIKKARTIYTDPKTQWIRDQVTDFLNDEANFLTALSSTKSNSGENGASA